MASLSLAHFIALPRCEHHWALRNAPSSLSPLTPKYLQLQCLRSPGRFWSLRARKKAAESLSQEEEETKTTKKKPGRPKKKKPMEEGSDSEIVVSEAMKAPRRIRKKAVSEEDKPKSEKKTRAPRKTKAKVAAEETEEASEEPKPEKRTKGRKRKMVATTTIESKNENGNEDAEETEDEPFFFPGGEEEEEDEEEEIEISEVDEETRRSYGWPPLVCCFGAAQHAFVPSGRPANRLVDHEIHARMRDAYWAPEKFVRAPGGSPGSVAIALASLGGKVAFMGKLGADQYGEAMLYYMNFNGVQTRSVKVDPKRPTAVTHMRISKRGPLRTTCIKPCAEDSLSNSEINLDVLKEAKILYCSTHSLLDLNMRSTMMRAIKTLKKLGGTVFYDVNLPMPLWRSREEAKSCVRQAWRLADIVEVTKQELEFLLGIDPDEEFDTSNNKASKFKHYGPEVIAPLWHDGLKVLFVTNGTSKIHYYTADHHGSVRGMEDPPLTPFTRDMSASGDGIIAGILRLLAVQMDLITDKSYLEHTIKFAIDCGVVDQWALGRVTGFPPREDMEGDEVEPDSNGISSITEKEYRTIKPLADSPFYDP